ncbi:OLC1v1030785C1 [Oldenlandia corymbosa var. corymbosa]|uniref:OLC1v1030785C1 n=1 Tax=Oldenlandia corymbosa var. corymbosa TaxID=529605 RepID=A0AAV1CK67_OLDCO|nr:OLC1v1030785C1 [Oldenlandia corymbosa var. corymbosa]
MERDYFFVTFTNQEDVTMVLEKGPWLIGNSYLYTQKWDNTFDAKVHRVRHLTVWTRLPGLPGHYCNNSFLRRISQLMGRVVHIDHQTDTKTRGKFARFAMEINLTMPLVSQFELRGRNQLVEYESLNCICMTCGRVGHFSQDCAYGEPKTVPPAEEDQPTGGQKAEANAGGNTDHTAGQKKQIFGEWMHAVKLGRQRIPYALRQIRGATTPHMDRSRFAALNSLKEDVLPDDTTKISGVSADFERRREYVPSTAQVVLRKEKPKEKEKAQTITMWRE